MDTLQILDVFHHDPCFKGRAGFLGVFPRDKLPLLKDPRLPLGLIINSDKANLPGQHWLAVFVNAKGHVCFFDSFGKSSLFYGIEIDKFICDSFPWTKGNYQENHTQVQHPRSSLCGLFSIFFLYFSCRGLSLAEIIRKFEYPKHLHFNDTVLMHFAKRIRYCPNPQNCLPRDSCPKCRQESLPMYKILSFN